MEINKNTKNNIPKLIIFLVILNKMKKCLTLFVFCLIAHYTLINCKEEKSVVNNLKKQATKTDDGIDGLGTSILDKGVKDASAASKLVITKPPFKVTECNQILMFSAEYIEDLRDYRKRKPAFFSINVLNTFVFEKKDATKLIHSSSFTTSKRLTGPLKGAKGCISIDGGKVNSDITICFKNEKDTDDLLRAIKSFSKCRMGDNLVPISPEKIAKIAQACGAAKKEEKDPVKDFEMSFDIRSGNKWDEDRAKFFQPSKIRVPGTPIISEEVAKKK